MENYDLLWIDLETTGDDPEFDKIIEIGAIFTDINLQEKFRFTTVVGGQDEIRHIINYSDSVVYDMHNNNGLLGDLSNGGGCSLKLAESILIDKMTWNGVTKNKPDQVVLAGSGVGHFDRKFIDQQMPDLARYLKYFVVDVGVMRRILSIVGHPDLALKTDRKTHRAMEDIELHVMELRHFRNMLNVRVNY